MADQEPDSELSPFSSAGATGWAPARAQLQDAPVYWLSTVRPDGRPHVTPLLALWPRGAMYFCTGSAERKVRNLAGTWFGLGDGIRTRGVLVYRVAPSTAFGFGKGAEFSQTRWRFSSRSNPPAG